MYPLLAASHDRVPADFHMLQYLSFTAETPVLQHMQICRVLWEKYGCMPLLHVRQHHAFKVLCTYMWYV